jgi:signal transduction histidine kinase
LVGIGLIEGDEMVFRTGAGARYDDPQFRPPRVKVGGKGITGRVAASGEPLLVPDVGREPQYLLLPGSSETRSELAVPLKTKSGIIGVLDVQSDQVNAFDETDLGVVQSLANLAAIAIEEARLFGAEQRRAEQFRVISEVGARITSILTVDELLAEIVRLVKETLGYYHTAIGLIDGDELVIKAGAGAHWETPQFQPSRLKVGGKGITTWVAAKGEPLLVPDVSREPRYLLLPEATRTRSELAVPLRTTTGVIGVLDVQSDQVNGFDESDLAVLKSVAHQAAVAIENARLYEQAQQAAVLEERSRLARDLHDAVTQTLFSASLIAEVVPTLWESDQDEGKQLLQELRQLTRGALAEMRTLLLELRPTALSEASLDELLHQLGEAVTGRSGVPVRVTIDGECDMPPDVHVALYRVAQEALNNVVKHARASEVEVNLRCTSLPEGADAEKGEEVELRVSDDGCGFDSSSVPPDRLGLGIIHERTQAIGATLEIESEPGEGTRVSVVWTSDE